MKKSQTIKSPRYIPIPNFLIENSNLSDSAFAVGLYLYSQHHSYGRNTDDASIVKVKQETIAASCGLSVDTVQRACASLIAEGFIIDRTRAIRRDGTLGTYTYALRKFDCNRDKYTFIALRAIKFLTAKEMHLYALFAKFKANYTNEFFHSLKDVSLALKASKAKVIALIKKLIEIGLVRKQLRKTNKHDYTENKYFVVCFVTGTLKKKRGQKKRNGVRPTVSPRSKISTKTRRHNNDDFLVYYNTS